MDKIIIINHYGVTPDLPGSSKHFDMANYFSLKKTHKIEYWMCAFNHKTGMNDPEIGKFRLKVKKKINDFFHIQKIKSSPYRHSMIMRQLNIVLFDLITAIKLLFTKNLKIVVLNTPPLTFFNVWVLKLKKIKMITDVEDLWPLFLIDLGLDNNLVINIMDKQSKYIYKNSFKISAVSEGMKNYVAGILGSEDNIWISPLGVNPDEYFDLSIDINDFKDKLWNDNFKVMYLGAHGKANDLFSVLETIKIMQDKNYFKVGDKIISYIFIGDGDQKENIIKYANDQNLENVYFENAVPSHMVGKYLSHADVCLTNLAKVESFKKVRPNKLFQYMALQKPIISGIWGEFQKIIEEENTGIYIDFTVPDVASENIYRLLNDKETLNEMSKNGRAYIDKSGNRYKIFERYYQEILSEKLIDKKIGGQSQFRD